MNNSWKFSFTVESIKILFLALNRLRQNVLTPIEKACMGGDAEALSDILRKRRKEKIFNSKEVSLALLLSVLKNHVECIRKILRLPEVEELLIFKATGFAVINHPDDNGFCLEALMTFIPHQMFKAFTLRNPRREALIPKKKLDDVRFFAMEVNLHPVRIAFNLVKYDLLGEVGNLKRVFGLKAMELDAENSSFNSLIIKLFYLSWVLKDIEHFCLGPSKSSTNSTSSTNKPNVKSFLRYVFKDCGRAEKYVDMNIWEFIEFYPLKETTLFLNMKRSLLEIPVNDGSLLWAFRVFLNDGNLQRRFREDFCTCCGNEGLQKKCWHCDKAWYCSKFCQDVHYHYHKRKCLKRKLQ